MIGQNDLRKLAEEQGFPRVSLFMPIENAGPDVRQNPIRAKNLLREAARLLEARGCTAEEIDALLKEARSQGDSETFWQRGSESMAIFISPERSLFLPVPMVLEEGVSVGSQYALRALLPLLMAEHRFFLLRASRSEVTLFRATPFGMTEVEDERLPRSAAAFLESTQFDNAVHFHSSSRGAEMVQFHSLGESPQDEAQEQVREYVRRLAKVVGEILGGQDAPLVLCADDRLLGMLRQSLRYPALVEEAIREHPESLDLGSLRERAYELARPQLEAGRRAAAERLEARLRSGEAPASERIEDIVKAAVDGRVDTLFVPSQRRIPGEIDLAAREVRCAKAEGEGTVDLVERAVLDTLNHGGRIYLEADFQGRQGGNDNQAPPVRAIYRY